MYNVDSTVQSINLFLQITTWSRGFPEKLTAPHLVQKFPAPYGTWRFITAFTPAQQLSLSSARPIQSTLPSYLLNTLFNIILPSMTRSSKWLFPSTSLTQKPCMYFTTPSSAHTCYTPRPSHSFRSDDPNNIW